MEAEFWRKRIEDEIWRGKGWAREDSECWHVRMENISWRKEERIRDEEELGWSLDLGREDYVGKEEKRQRRKEVWKRRLERDCLKRIKTGMAIHQSNALFKGYCQTSTIFNFIKGSLSNLQKKIQHINGSTIPDCLDDFGCSSFFIIIFLYNLRNYRICQNLHG